MRYWEKSKLVLEQGGTIDQIFTLRQMAERCTEYNQDLFTCYIDFKKAFDSVWRTGLWRVMRSLRYPEKIIRILEDMYEGTLSAVRRSEEHTSELQSPCNIVCRLLLEKKKKK